MRSVLTTDEGRGIKGAAAFLLALAIISTGCGGTPQSSGRNGHKTLSSLLISPSNPVVAIGDSERFVVIGIYRDGSKQDMTNSVVWTIDDPGIATIDSSGMATAKQAGSAEITATFGTISATVKLTVPAAALISISITPPASTVPKGSMEQLSAMGTYSDGTTKDVTGMATWASSAPNIAAVSSTGMVSGAATGTANVTATSGRIRGAEMITVAQAALVSLVITPPNFSLAKGRTQQLSVTGNFGDGNTEDLAGSVAWTVSAATVASVSNTGLVTALGMGTATIMAISGPIGVSTTLTVSPPMLTSLAITPPNPFITRGSSQQLAVTGTFTDGSTQSMTGTVAWTVSPANIVAVSNSGVVTTIANGTAMVTATSGSVSGSDMVTVSGATLTSIAISPTNPSLNKGKTQQLTATGTYSDGTKQDITNKVSWTGSAPNVIDLSNTGLITAKGPGNATVTATSGSVSASDTITVSATLVSIAISPANASIPKGETQQLAATGTYDDGSTQDISNKVTWSATTSGAVTFSATGLITAQALGTATITATYNSISGTTGVTVSAAVPVSLTVLPANQTISVGATLQLRAIENFSDGTKRTVTNSAAWTSTTPDIATVDASGLATGAGEGVVTIRVTYRNVSGSGSFTVIPITYVVTEDESTGGKFGYSYFDHANTPGVDSTFRIASSGIVKDICAMVYVFSADQQLSECCGCRVSRNGLRTLSLDKDLTSNPLTRKILTNGTVKVVAADETSNPKCDPASATPAGTLTVWSTHIQTITTGSSAPVGSGSQLAAPTNQPPMSLEAQCQFIEEMGSGFGICTCGSGD